MSITIYSIKQEHGMKIGMSTNWKSRLKAYHSQGNTVNIFKIAHTDDEKLDSMLKRTLYQLNLNISIDNQSSTEVYNLTDIQTNRILTYIDTGKPINEEIITYLINGNFWKVIKITIEKFRRQFGTKYIQFTYQREPNKQHIQEILNYIYKNYNRSDFYLPDIIVSKSGKNKYEILDGNHRFNAFLQIDNNHPSLQTEITIKRYEFPNDIDDKVFMFRNINKGLAMDDIYVTDNYIEETIQFTYNNLKKKINDSLSIDELKKLITQDNIVKFLKLELTDNINMKNIYQLLLQLNETINDVIVAALEIDYFYIKKTDISNISVEFWNDLLVFYNNLNNRTSSLPFLKRKLERIRNSYKGKNKQTKKIKIISRRKRPFCLNLICTKSTTIAHILLNIDNILKESGFSF